MKKLIALGLVTIATMFASSIDISTGVAAWQVSGPAFTGTPTSLTPGQVNPGWAPTPAGSSWLSWGSVQGTTCVVGQSPGNGCASALTNVGGDTWTYTLTISAATLGTNNGILNFVFGADNRVTMEFGLEPVEVWDGGSSTNGTGFTPLGCSGAPPVSAGSSQATYNSCITTASFNSNDLNGNGSLTLTAIVNNDPVDGCTICNDPTGFVLQGDIFPGVPTTGAPQTGAPEPGTFGLLGAAGLGLFMIRRTTGPVAPSSGPRVSPCEPAPRTLPSRPLLG